MRAAVLLLVALSCDGVRVQTSANPIRKVVNLLQNLQAKVTAEGEKETELFEKFECYCKNGVGTLEQSIADAETKITELEASIKSQTAEKKQLDEDLKQAKADRSAAKEAVAEATAIRKKEAAAFAKDNADSTTNLAALAKAVAAIAKGSGESFLQTSTAATIRNLVVNMNMGDADRQELVSFLSGEQSYAPQSGEILGMLKQMHDEMAADLKAATDAENAAIKAFDELVAAKKKEIASLSEQIEVKTARAGEIAMAIANVANDIEDTKESLADDKKFLADLEKNCGTKKALYEENMKMRGQELVALADTIKILNDDDALELFKKTLPSSASLLQVKIGSSMVRARALALLQNTHRPELDLIALALRGKSAGFEKVIKMIDDMVGILKTEQKDDDEKKAYCAEEFDLADDKKKELELNIKDLETAIEEAQGETAKLQDEVAALEAGIKALDKSVAEATEQRKEENAEYKELMSNDGAAKELLAFAKNRLNKFYNPKLYKPPPKRELSEEDRITVNMGGTLAPTQAPAGIAGTGITALAQREAPPPPPETMGAYTKSSEENNGVIAMIDVLVKDLDKEMTVATTEEKDAQADYEKMMADSADKRAQDSKSVEDKKSAIADLAEAIQGDTDSKDSASKELGATLERIHALHGECDWLVKYYDARKEARVGEVEALGNAKAVLNGADYSF
jgi:septal ring factor EnvC (AmiA/AmiB activator)